ncbi:MAG: GNAT family N-acetyltransferase [Cytophagaceae bacterium]|nr:GNAT family N-acetyltransferase [Cytophagaceae bacterium]
MKNSEIKIDKDCHLSFEGFLFNNPEQIANQGAAESHLFHFIQGDTSKGRFIIFMDGQTAKSPLRAPFGSFEFDQTLSSDDVKSMIAAVDDYCIKRNIKNIRIVSYPFCYAVSQSNLLTDALKNAGYEIIVTDLNFHLDTARNFEAGLHTSEKRRLKKCIGQNFEFKVTETPEVSALYHLIKASRDNKGYPVTMTEEELGKIFKKFPDKYVAFSLYDKNKLIAASIGVKVTSEILYHFLPADHIAYKNYSPMVLLIKNIFEYCHQNGFKIFDLGIATAGGVPNEGLIRFKENIGSIRSLKFTFYKNYNS